MKCPLYDISVAKFLQLDAPLKTLKIFQCGQKVLNIFLFILFLFYLIVQKEFLGTVC